MSFLCAVVIAVVQAWQFPLRSLAQGSTPLDLHLPSNTILPTDLVPLPNNEEREIFGDTLQFRLWQHLPARFYFSSSVETSLRDETNVFQYPTKRQLLRQLNLARASPALLLRDRKLISKASVNDGVFRVTPSLTAGWAFTDRTRAYTNYFMIRDSLFDETSLDTVIQSVGGGLEHDFPIGTRANLQTQFGFRELYQTNQIPVFDWLPAMTLTYHITPSTVGYINTILQLRGKQFFIAPNREIDPFYTVGFIQQHGLWTLSSTATFLQNFRHQFGRNALIPINSYSWICDFEIARRLFQRVPVQAFVRAEPVWNFHSHNTPSLAGMDFRIYGGVRASFGKPAITTSLKEFQKMIKQQEQAPSTTPQPGAPAGDGNTSDASPAGAKDEIQSMSQRSDGDPDLTSKPEISKGASRSESTTPSTN